MTPSMELGQQLPIWMLIPFAMMLLCVAIFPIVFKHWFESNLNKAIVSVVLGVPVVIYLVVAFGSLGWEMVGSTAEEYLQFIVLLLALFAISGGIYISGNLLGTPLVNLTILAIGAVLANLIGTMGASMVLIWPLLRANYERKYSVHTVIFFIFVVSNAGGLLTPLGDPPLFLGFLRGVPFQWTLQLWPQWLLSVGLLLIVYTAFEIWMYRKEPLSYRRFDIEQHEPLRITGLLNVLILLLVIVTTLLSSYLSEIGEHLHFPLIREVIFIILIIISVKIAPHAPRVANQFTWVPIVEVAVLFAGVFATMIPALAIMEARGSALGLSQPWQYFWLTGGLSGFLDNAPTYLTFSSVIMGEVGVSDVGGLTTAATGADAVFSPAYFLQAISCGAVMMGAFTYIGNAPNLTVKCIAQNFGVKMPSFLGYMFYSALVLLPIYVVVTLVFFL